MVKLPIPLIKNCYGNSVVDWSHWGVRPRVWLGFQDWLPCWLWSFLDRHNILIYGDAEDCWVGGYELEEGD